MKNLIPRLGGAMTLRNAARRLRKYGKSMITTISDFYDYIHPRRERHVVYASDMRTRRRLWLGWDWNWPLTPSLTT